MLRSGVVCGDKPKALHARMKTKAKLNSNSVLRGITSFAHRVQLTAQGWHDADL